MNPNSPPTYGNYGCMDTAALNFDIAATHPCSAGFPSFACANCNSQPDYCGPGTGYGQCCIYPQPVPGCTDLNACNYDATATTDDGSCEYISCVGCIDSTACNYDPTSTLDDGSCEYTSCLGCTDQTANNYNQTATIDDGSCTYDIYGCIDPTACNPCQNNCNQDDGSCEYTSCMGCTVPTAVNYDQTATISCPNCCVLPIDGCTDVLAINYDVNANVDDGSCVYEVEPEKCSSQLDIGCWVCKDPINFPGCQQISNMNQVTMATGYGLQGFNNQQDCVNNTPCGKNPCDKVTLLNKINTQYNLGILEFCKYCNGGMIQDPSCKCCKRFQKDKKPKKDIMGEEIKRYKQLL
tara:strand:+ start:301 stop:1353 length:1053 start_codon:yes stop_codon:yes gene_type:complete